MTTESHRRGVFCAALARVTEDLAPHHGPGRGDIDAAARTTMAIRPRRAGPDQGGS